ncbi:hypothetical protein KUCAC02_017598 [Chaenocephalus aceratus]|uniref:Uncharacterized protein n=1 Tax=Chaenocephalus aceratus TaxID=36190 RepID=A0ACB9W2F2_CHAAC|nr:hypothetical protein KUCAC02_017598 [Chaenocephalus aceratus]
MKRGAALKASVSKIITGEQHKSSIKMDYKYDNGLELLLAHMNLEDIHQRCRDSLSAEEDGEEGGLSLEEESLSQEEMDENEETVVAGNSSHAALYPEEIGVLLNKDMAVKKGRYQINIDVLLYSMEADLQESWH